MLYGYSHRHVHPTLSVYQGMRRSFMRIVVVDAYLLVGLGIVIGLTISTVFTMLPVRNVDRHVRQYVAKVLLTFIEIPALMFMAYLVAR